MDRSRVWWFLGGLAALSLLIWLAVSCSAQERQRQINEAPQRVADMATVCATAMPDLDAAQNAAQLAWRTERGVLAPNRLVGDLSFGNDPGQKIFDICSRVTGLKGRLEAVKKLEPSDKTRDDEMVAIYWAVDVSGLRDALGSPSLVKTTAANAVKFVRRVENDWKDITISSNAVNKGGAEEEQDDAEDDIDLGWSAVARGDWASASMYAASASSHVSQANDYGLPPSPTPTITNTPRPWPTDEPAAPAIRATPRSNNNYGDGPALRPTPKSSNNDGPQLRPTP